MPESTTTTNPLSDAATQAQAASVGIKNQIASVDAQTSRFQSELTAAQNQVPPDEAKIESITAKLTALKQQKLKLKASLIAKAAAIFPCLPPGLSMPLNPLKPPAPAGQGAFDPNSNNPDNGFIAQARKLLDDAWSELLQMGENALAEIIQTVKDTLDYIIEALFGWIPDIETIISEMCEAARAKFEALAPDTQNILADNLASRGAGMGQTGVSYADYYKAGPLTGDAKAAPGANSKYRCFPNMFLKNLPCAILKLLLQPVVDALEIFWKPLFTLLAAAATLLGKPFKWGGQAGEDAAAAAEGKMTESDVSKKAVDIDSLKLLSTNYDGKKNIWKFETTGVKYVKVPAGWNGARSVAGSQLYGEKPTYLENIKDEKLLEIWIYSKSSKFTISGAQTGAQIGAEVAAVTYAVEGAQIGAAVGGVPGAAVGAVVGAVIGAVGGGFAGAIYGGLTGKGKKSEGEADVRGAWKNVVIAQSSSSSSSSTSNRASGSSGGSSTSGSTYNSSSSSARASLSSVTINTNRSISLTTTGITTANGFEANGAWLCINGVRVDWLSSGQVNKHMNGKTLGNAYGSGEHSLRVRNGATVTVQVKSRNGRAYTNTVNATWRSPSTY